MVQICGIWGICYGPNGPEGEDWTPSEFMQILFPAIVHRGPHAFGWMDYTDGEVHITKHVGRSDTREALSTMDLPGRPNWVVGHVRFATHGSPENLINNHPIRHGNVVGVHNGVLRNHLSVLKETGREDPAAEVDSEAIFAAVNRWGHRQGLRRIEGDMVAVYTVLDKPEVLHVARTWGRPLVYTRTPAGSIIFASEERVIEATGIAHGQYYQVGSNRLLRLRDGEVRGRVELAPTGAWRAYDGAVPLAATEGRVRNITDHFNRASTVSRITSRGEKIFGQRPPPSIPPRVSAPPARVPVNSPQALEDYQRATEQVRTMLAEQRAKTTSDARARNLKDGDEWNGLFYYKGRLYTEKEYMDIVFDEMVTEGRNGDGEISS